VNGHGQPISSLTVIEAVPEPMLHLDADGVIAASNAAARELLGDWIQGRSYATVLRSAVDSGRIETVQADGTPGEARFELADSAGGTQFRVRITALQGNLESTVSEGARGGALSALAAFHRHHPSCARPRKCGATSSPMSATSCARL
jgi:transcriptional regulator of aromatic amino acid metabolism